MANRLCRVFDLSWPDRHRLLVCAVGVRLVHISLALLGYAATRRLVERLSRRGRPHATRSGEMASAQSVASLAAIAGRHGLMKATCLRQALFVYGWLRLRGLRPQLQLGVQPHDAAISAHAWVELDGVRLRQADRGHVPFVQAATRQSPP